jgi:four helix bundle protein
MVTKLEDLRVLRLAEELADSIWEEVKGLNEFEREVIGKQLVRAVDSIGANIAEAYGRYHYGEKIQFLYFARGSLFESKYWLNRIVKRGLMSSDISQKYLDHVSNLARQINAFVKNLRSQKNRTLGNSSKVEEEIVIYEI